MQTEGMDKNLLSRQVSRRNFLYVFLVSILVLFSKKSSDQYLDQSLDFICDKSLTCRGLNLNVGYFCGSAILPSIV
jgi:hypothetical protein